MSALWIRMQGFFRFMGWTQQVVFVAGEASAQW